MTNYLIRRLLIGGITLILITFVVYGLVRSMPGDPLAVQAAEDPNVKINEERQAQRRAELGLDKPFYVGYFRWASKVARFDLGNSVTRKQPVRRLIVDRIGATLLLSIPAMLITYWLSIPMGLYATARSGLPDERSTSVALYMLYSFPAFVAALLLQIAFAIHLDLLPLFGMVSDDHAQLSFFAKLKDILRHMTLPLICLTYGSLAYYSRFVKANMEEVIRQDYIRTARAKGVNRWKILTRHAFRNTMIPLVTLMGLTLPGLLSGAVIIEQIFTWPGMGRLFFESITERDYDTIMGLTLVFSVLALLGQLIADILYAVVDPRVSYS
jgi:peptide/nickel transport system permease protein